MEDYMDIEYLKRGNEVQRRSYEVLRELNLMEYLQAYSPVLTGTIPIQIDIEGSDLDIICEVGDFDSFEDEVGTGYGRMQGYRVAKTQENIVINFVSGGMEIEVYGMNRPTHEQNAYCHMLVESRLLQLGGEDFREKIIDLKKHGIKTEPAFCRVLGVEGNPYENMLDEALMTEALKKTLEG